jgi:branched-subunit amino acid aminotransferase/4-amino-4-deoxychorismate lyase
MSAQGSWVWFNGEWMSAASVRISPLSEGFMFGFGLFETIGMADGRPVFVAAHHERMARSAARLGLNVTSTVTDWARQGAELARRNGHESGVLKRVIFKDVNGVSDLMSSRPNPYSEKDYASGFSLKTKIEARPEGAARDKSLSYLDDLVARQRARADGFKDALYVGAGGEIYEGAATNFFAIIDGRLVTSPVEKHIIPGVIRAQIVKLVNGEQSTGAIPDTELRDVLLGADVRPLTLAEVRGADEVFVTNAALGVMPVSRIDETIFPLRPHGIVPHLRRALARAQKASLVDVG